MPDPDLDDLMREYDAEVAAYRQLPQAEPTALLDRAVLAKARAAAAHAHRPPRWIALAASFAGIAIAAGIGWRVHEASESARDAASRAPAAREEVFEVQVLPSGSRERAKAIEMGQLPAPPPPPPAAPQPLASPPAESPPEPQAFATDALERDQASPEPVIAAEAAATAPLRDSEPEPHVRSDHSIRGGAPEQRQNMAAPASSAPAPTASSLDLSAGSDERKRLGKSERDEGTALGATAQQKDDEAAALGAEDWLKRIRRLVRERRINEAQSEMQRFRELYPDVPIPADLRRYAR